MTGKKDYSILIVPPEENAQSGVYLLGVELAQACALSFGRHNRGKPVQVPAGRYVYIGSASGQKGSSALGPRLLRHTCRSGGKPPHDIQPALYERLNAAGLPGKLPTKKTVHWHIDYLLDLAQAEIFFVLAWRTTGRIEKQVAAALAEMTETGILSKGLGASDHPGGTHLLRVQARERWWAGLADRLSRSI